MMDSLFDKNCFTPLTPSNFVSDSNKNLRFCIPVYQRLFVWEEKEINQLLNDLWDAFSQNDKNVSDKQPYYIGIITVVKKEKDRWEIIDGQQRLTFLTLLGACLGEEWKDFLYINTRNKGQNDQETRIQYSGRPDDQKDLENLSNAKIVVPNGAKKLDDKNDFNNSICKKSEWKNPYFRRFFECMVQFQSDKGDIRAFSKYVFWKTSFLIAELPANYKTKDLNLFFEKMNSSGKQLTPVEQIKGKFFAERATDFDKCIYFENEERKGDKCNPSQSILDVLNDTYTKVDNEPLEEHKSPESRFILDPEIFLLHSLVIAHCLKNGDEGTIPHSKQKLLEAFNEYVGKVFSANGLLSIMEGYRLWMDDNILYLKYNDDGSYDYRFILEDAVEKIKDKECPQQQKNNLKRLNEMKQFQAMLFVSSSTDWQEWILKSYLECIKTENKNKTLDLEWLKRIDKVLHVNSGTVLSTDALTYPAINRYWFFLLDYILWEKSLTTDKEGNENELFKPVKECFNNMGINNIMTTIKNYIFRQNNKSREHLYPQTKNENTTEEMHSLWIAENTIKNDHDTEPVTIKNSLDWFGNLALISIPSNSEQGNDSFDIKIARAKEQLKNGKLESIKMLLMFAIAKGDEKGWNPDVSANHGMQMYELLKNYYESIPDTKE